MNEKEKDEDMEKDVVVDHPMNQSYEIDSDDNVEKDVVVDHPRKREV